jgi:hypothetical protein
MPARRYAADDDERLGPADPSPIDETDNSRILFLSISVAPNFTPRHKSSPFRAKLSNP